MKVIGRVEKADFPEWNLIQLDAKIDTGAYTSSLHCHHIELSRDRDEVSFLLLDPSHPEYHNRSFRASVQNVKSIRSSNGLSEERIIIKTKIRMHGKTRIIELSLTDRSGMRFPVLLGRKFLKNRYLVDVSRSYTEHEP